MFTGIVEAVGEVRRVRKAAFGAELAFSAPFARELAPGQSIAVDGACLTAAAVGEDGFTVHAGSSTLERTVAGRYREGSLVNLERAVRMGARVDGHWVQGHVDGTGALLGIEERGETRLLDFELPREVFHATILHGSVAIHGISLTVHALAAPARCQVAIIPYTWAHTNLSTLVPGDPVNVEADLIGKHVRRFMELRG